MNTLLGKLVVLSFVIGALVGCAGIYVGKPASKYQKFSCDIATERCGISWQNGSSIIYEVDEIASNRYQVTGTIDYQIEHGAIRNFVVFHLLFMNDEKVLHSKRVETFSTHGTLNFEFETDETVTRSTIEALKLYVRS